jgi:ABC-2 type transport system ATP-binding protein
VTLLAPTTGRAMVAGFDVAQNPKSVRPLINMVSGGESSGYGLLTVRENLWLFGQFYGLDNKTTRLRTDELLEVVGIEGSRQHEDFGPLDRPAAEDEYCPRASSQNPEVIFLDEPTSGTRCQRQPRCAQLHSQLDRGETGANHAAHHALHG